MSSRSLTLREPRGFAADTRFFRDMAEEVEQVIEEEPQPDPLEEAFARGYAEGEAEARKQFEIRLGDIRQQFAGLDRGFAELACDEADRLQERLRDTVIALCESAIAPMALDMQLLAKRVECAAGMLMRAQDQRRIRLHPDDLQQVRMLVSDTLALEADPALERGALRIETEDGGIEDGPEAWQQAIREAIGQC